MGEFSLIRLLCEPEKLGTPSHAKNFVGINTMLGFRIPKLADFAPQKLMPHKNLARSPTDSIGLLRRAK